MLPICTQGARGLVSTQAGLTVGSAWGSQATAPCLNSAQQAHSKAAPKVLRKHIFGEEVWERKGKGRKNNNKKLTLAIFTKWLRISALIFKVCAVRISRTTQKLTCRVKYTHTHTHTRKVVNCWTSHVTHAHRCYGISKRSGNWERIAWGHMS